MIAIPITAGTNTAETRSAILAMGALVAAAQLPPMYLVTSAEDLIRPDTLKFAQLLAANGREHRLTDLPRGKQHRLVHVFCVQYPTWSESRHIYTEIDAFFRNHA